VTTPTTMTVTARFADSVRVYHDVGKGMDSRNAVEHSGNAVYLYTKEGGATPIAILSLHNVLSIEIERGPR
jgi:hypothetical protein